VASAATGFIHEENTAMTTTGASLSDVEAEAEAEAPEAVVFWWKRKRLKICRFHFHSVSKLLFEFW
jgi:hypothetical protein